MGMRRDWYYAKVEARGEEAALRGEGKDTNPYPTDTMAHNLWEQGWFTGIDMPPPIPEVAPEGSPDVW